MKVKRTDVFDSWLGRLRDTIGKAKILARIRRIENSGYFGDHKEYGIVGELRFDTGPGYRVYYTKVHDQVVFLMFGADKSTQHTDFEEAKRMAEQIRKENDSEHF